MLSRLSSALRLTSLKLEFMDERKGDPPAAEPAPATAAAAPVSGSELKDDDQPAAAAAPSDAAAVSPSRLLPARAEVAECDICNKALESSEAAGAAAASESRLPRQLPCGHSWCTSCIQKSLDANGGLLKCHQCGDLNPQLRLVSALKLPKNLGMIKLMDAQADRDAMAELAAPPCHQCDPTRLRQAARFHCPSCAANYCQSHDDQVHCVAPLSGHRRVRIEAHAAQLSAASAAQKASVLAAAAATCRRAAKEERKKVDETLSDVKARAVQMPIELNLTEAEVDSTAKKLQETIDRLRSDFQQHRQNATQASRLLVKCAAELSSLGQTTDRVQQSADFDANLQFAQLQRDSPQVHAQAQQALLQSRRSCDLGSVHELQAWLSLSHTQRQSAILNEDLTAKLAPFFKGVELKAQPSLLFRASRDGFELDDWTARSAGKGPTITLIESGDGYVFGAYSRCSWPAADGLVADPSGQSFLFSLTNQGDQPLRFSLRDTDRAIYKGANGVRFGYDKTAGRSQCNSNLCLMVGGRAANDDEGNFVCDLSNQLSAYKADGGATVAKDLVAGGFWFSAAEIEVFQL